MGALKSWVRIPPSENPAAPAQGAPCPVCRTPSPDAVLTVHKRLVAACPECGHHFVRNPWSEGEIERFYEGFEYFRKNCVHQGMDSIENDAQWVGWLGERVRQLDEMLLSGLGPGPLRLLEVGCLEGRVLGELAKRGHTVLGCDVNAEVAQAGARHFGLDIRAGRLEQCGFEPASFDAVFSFHTLEHLRDPMEALALQHSLVRPGGAVFFEVPLNETDYDNRDHLHFFSQDSIGRAVMSRFDDFSHKVHRFRTAGGTLIESILVAAFRK